MIDGELIQLAKDYIEKNNPGNRNEYHNNQHMLFVYDRCLEIFNDYISKNKMSEMAIEDSQLILSLAALFHDYNHTGGGVPDSENIERAVEGFYDFIDYLLENHKIELPVFVMDAITECIQYTEFPHKPISEKALLCNIIRDADTIGGLYDGWEDVVRNICKEMKKPVEAWIPIQHKFIHNITYKTEFAQKLANERKKEVLQKLLTLK